MHRFSSRLRIPIPGGIAFTFLLMLAGCSPKMSDQIVATVGNDKISLADYEKMYNGSSASHDAGPASSQEEREKFLDLMIKYRLKLGDAYRQGLDRKPEILNEIEQYRGGLAQSFLTEREVVAPGLRRLYQQGSEEIRASHILISLRRDASPDDSLIAYRKAYDIIKRLKGGADFGALAEEVSQDPSAKQNKGDLYYFTAGQMVPAFEEAAFAMKVGEISSDPVRTQFGLHIIKITDRRPAPGEVHCSHIMIRFRAKNPPPEDTAAAFEKIKAIQDSLRIGVDFAELARRNSGDMGSATRGGDLGWFTRRRWVQPFDEVALSLKPGQVSGIVRTIYGYHLIKCTDTRPRKTFEEAKPELQRVYQQSRFQDDYSKYLDSLKKLVVFTRDAAVANRFIASCDSTKLIRDSAWAAGIGPELGTAAMFTVGGKPVSVDSVISILKSRPDLAETPVRAMQMLGALDKVAEQLVFAARSVSLERENPEFANILKEYKEGLLIYQIEQDRVWNRIAPSDSVLQVYYAANKEKFVFPDRLNISQIRCASEARANEVYEKLHEGKTLEQIVADDSARMARPTSSQLSFAGGSSTVSSRAAKVLSAAAAECVNDNSLTIRLLARADTSTSKERHLKLATARINALKSYLMSKLRIPVGRIATSTQQYAGGTAPEEVKASDAATAKLTVELTGRQPVVVGKPETSSIPVQSDERAKRADSLATGGFTRPVYYSGGYCIVRLNAREPSRIKTFEEAGAEVSSAYQEYESKRLEAEWLDSLRKQSPVVEHKELLKYAFAPER